MTPTLDFVASHWLGSGLVAAGVVLSLLAVRLRRWNRGPLTFVLGVAAFLAGLGGWLLPAKLALGLAIAATGLFVTLVVVLLLTGDWRPAAAWSVLAVGVLACGGLWLDNVQRGLIDFGKGIASIEILHPWWLLLLLLLPVFYHLAKHRLTIGGLTPHEERWLWRRVWPLVWLLPPVGLVLLARFLRRNWHQLHLDSWRTWVSLGLRCALVVFLTLALAEPRLRQTNENTTVLFVVDRSQSIPQDFGPDPEKPGGNVDRRARRINNFINNAVRERGAGHERDKAGLIVFGRRPRLELPPSDAPRFNLKDLPGTPDGNYTDIAAALKLALASFPEGTGKRIVLISDGNENLGKAEEQALLAKTLGVQIDVLPLAAGQKNKGEVLVERVVAPPFTEQGAKVPIRVQVRSFNPQHVLAQLVLRQITEKERDLRVVRQDDGGLGVRVEANKGASGVRIVELAERSPLAAVGLKVNEEIVKFDDMDLVGPDRVARVMAKKKPGAPVNLTVRRDAVALVEKPRTVRLREGLNSFSFTRELTDEQRSYTYEAEIQPLAVVDDEGKEVPDSQEQLRSDRKQNNRASTHVVARGRRRILLLESRPPGKEDQVLHSILADKLREAGDRKFRLDLRPIQVLNNYPDRDKLAVFLSDYDCVILANVPAEDVSEEQQEALRSNTHDQGCGLVMIGGKQAYGAGGWQNTAIEKALPVDADIKALKVQGKGGLVLVMHASEMADGNFWQKKIAKLAIERLGPTDMVGVIDFDMDCKWHVPFQEVGIARGRLMGQIDKMMPGDMPDFDPALELARKDLTKQEHGLSTKHIIIISDGDPQCHLPGLAAFKKDKITITTVGVVCHGINEDTRMKAIATATGGRFHPVQKPDELPAIYIKESRLVSQSFVEERRFHPILVFRGGPTERLPDPLELRGFVRTTPKASPLVEIPIMTPRFNDQDFPLLAYWHYGLGKSVAFTSDAGDPTFWSRAWVEGGDGQEGMYARFWEQVIEWSLRPTESNRLAMTTEYHDGKIRITVEAQTEAGRPDNKLQLRGGITTPSAEQGDTGKKRFLQFTQRNSGIYEAEIKAEEAGSYFITAQATRTVKVLGKDGKWREIEEGVDSVRSGVTLPYSPEYADLETNTALLERLRELTDGQAYQDDDAALAEVASKGMVFRPGLPRVRSLLPLWQWLVLLTGVLLFFDIAVRRVALDTSAARAWVARAWARVRGQVVPEPEPSEYLDRLRNRKTQTVGARPRAAQRFEGGPVLGGVPPLADVAPTTAPPPVSRAETSKPPAETETDADFVARMQRAKKKAWEEHDKGT
jgi:hypothetical protein